MEPISAIASVLQLLSQVVTALRVIQESREIARGYPKLLHEYTEQVESLQKTLEHVKAQEDLRIPSILEQVEVINGIVCELTESLEKLRVRTTKSSVRRHFHALVWGPQEATELANLVYRLDSAHSQLSARIQLVHVNLTRQFNNQWEATLPVLHRVDQNVQSVLKSRPQSSSSLRVSQGERGYKANMCFDNAWQMNGDIDEADWNSPSTIEYNRNQAHGNSLQINGRMQLASFIAVLRSRE